MRTAVAAIVLFGAASFTTADAATAIPAAPTHFVTDTVSALSTQKRASLETQLHDYQTKTGHQVIVYISDTTGDTPLEDWTSQAGHAWKVGRKGKDDGAILFAFMHDHKVRIEVGYGLEGDLTDARSKQIIDQEIVPQMKAGSTDAAVQNGINAMLQTITADYKPAAGAESTQPASSDDSSDGMPILVALLVIFLVLVGVGSVIYSILCSIFHWKRPGWLILASSSSGWSSSSSSGGDSGFSGGGGDFGGGGASGSW